MINKAEFSSPLSEEAIRPKDLMKAKEACVEHDRNFLLAHRGEWTKVACPACGHSNSEYYDQKQGYIYEKCINCETVFTNPRPSEQLLHKFYSQSPNYEFWNKYIFPTTDVARKKNIYRPRAAMIERYINEYGCKTESFLEIGAGFGSFCEVIRELGVFRRIVAVEPTPDLAGTCRKKGFEVFEAPIEKINLGSMADVVAAFEVIEHLFDPGSFIAKCHSILKSNGLFVLSCPNVKGFDVSTLGTLSGSFDHEHINYFHPGSLVHLLKKFGFDDISVVTPGRLDADIVRKHILDGRYSLEGQPFLQEVLINRWEELGGAFQNFLAENKLSSHMIAFARKTK